MKAFLVDPAARTVHAVDVTDDIKAARSLIGVGTVDTALIDRAGAVSVMAIVDDTGLLKSLPCFRFGDYRQPLAGKALLLGCDQYGASVDCPLELGDIEARTQWVDSAHAIAQARANQASSAADYRARGFNVETSESGLVNVITAPEDRRPISAGEPGMRRIADDRDPQ